MKYKNIIETEQGQEGRVKQYENRLGNVEIKKMAAIISEHLLKNGIEAVLVGGACVSIYSDNNYLSYDIDFITTSSIKTMIPVLEQLGFKKATDNKSPGYLLKYGCCNKKLEKYYDEIELEINGINGSIKDWQEIL